MKEYAESDERQTKTKLKDIRRDHVARYEFVNQQLNGFESIVDACCGVGYGSNIMAKVGHRVQGIDISEPAIKFARKHWSHPRATFVKADLSQPGPIKDADIAVAFECVEHIADPAPLLKALKKSAGVLFVSVPNQDNYPWHHSIAFHHRHYTKGQFNALLNSCGWQVAEWFGQEGSESEVEIDVSGRTLVAKCVHGVDDNAAHITFESQPVPKAPGHITILGLGPSLEDYTNITRRMGGRHRYCDQVWAMNALGSIIQCDKIFHMDDVRIQAIRGEAKPDGNTAAMLEWMKSCAIPIITSRPHPDYPCLQAFPLKEVLNTFNTGYFNSTAAYAVAYAIWSGAEKISLFGCDYTYPDAHDAEKGRACVEFWLGMAAERGIKLVVPRSSTLLDAIHSQAERFYGYDTLDLNIYQDEDGIGIDFTERSDLPSAEEIERNYDHGKHPNALIEENDDEEIRDSG